MKVAWFKAECISADHDGYCSGEENVEKITEISIPLEIAVDEIENVSNYKFEEFISLI